MNSLPTAEGRKDAFAKMQKYVLEQVYTVPLGSFTKVQARAVQREGLRAVPHPAHVERVVHELSGRHGRHHPATTGQRAADPAHRQR